MQMVPSLCDDPQAKKLAADYKVDIDELPELLYKTYVFYGSRVRIPAHLEINTAKYTTPLKRSLEFD